MSILPELPRGAENKETRPYELEINRWVLEQAEPGKFNQLTDRLLAIVDEAKFARTPEDLDQPFDAFFALASLYRRHAKVSQLEDLLASRRKLFEASYKTLISHLEIMCLNLKGDRKSCLKALEKAEELWKSSQGKHAGLSHSYAETVALCVNEGYRSWDEDLLEKGLRAADDAIEQDPDYAKFYRTRGWLYFLLRNAEEGRRWYQRAVELEDPQGRDYASRVAEYRRELVMRNARLDLDKLQAELALLRTKADEIQTRQLEFLGFFTGILALILASGGLLLTAKDDAARIGLMVTLAGLLLFIFGGFGFMLHGWEKNKRLRSILPALLGLLLLGIGVGFWFFTSR